MSFFAKVRYRLGRFAARGRAYESTMDNDAVRMAVFQGASPLSQEAAAEAIARSEDPGQQEDRELGTEL